MPAISSMKYGTAARLRAGRAMMSPQASARAAESDRAALWGYHPRSSASWRIRRRVVSETPGRPLRAHDTAPLDTPALVARSAIVIRRPLLTKALGLSREDGGGAGRAMPHGTNCQEAKTATDHTAYRPRLRSRRRSARSDRTASAAATATGARAFPCRNGPTASNANPIDQLTLASSTTTRQDG